MKKEELGKAVVIAVAGAMMVNGLPVSNPVELHADEGDSSDLSSPTNEDLEINESNVSVSTNSDYIYNSEEDKYYTSNSSCLSLNIDFTNALSNGIYVSSIRVNGTNGTSKTLSSDDNTFFTNNAEELGDLSTASVTYVLSKEGNTDKEITTSLSNFGGTLPSISNTAEWVVDVENPTISNVQVSTSTNTKSVSNGDNISLYADNTTDFSISFSVSDDTKVETVKLLVNNSEITLSEENGIYTGTTTLSGSSNTIVIKVTDILGKSSDNYSFNVNPISDIYKFTVDGNYTIGSDGITYFNGTLTGKITNWSILSDAEKLSFEPYTVSVNSNPSAVTIENDGTFTFGEENEFTLSSTKGNISVLTDSSISSSFVKDTSIPTARMIINKGMSNEKTINGISDVGVIGVDETVGLAISDDAAIKDIAIKINNVEVISNSDVNNSEYIVPTISFSSNGNLNINGKTINAPSDGIYNVEVIVNDNMLNHLNTDSFTIKVDYITPEISEGTIEDGYGSMGSNIYIQKDTLISGISATDSLSNVESLTLNGRMGTEEWEKDILDINTFKIEKTGKYTVTAVDSFGNSVTKPLEQLLGLGSNKTFIVDNNAPKINPTDDTKSVTEEVGYDGKVWVTEPVELEYNIEDDNFRSVTVSIEQTGNNAVTYTTNDTKVLITIPEGAYGKVDYTIEALDYSRRKSTYKRTLYVDMTAPEINSYNLKAVQGTLYNNILYTRTPVELKINSEDNFSGVKNEGIYFSDNTETSKNSEGYSVLNKSGKYYYKSIDNVGNATDNISLDSYLNTSEILIDSSVPTISVEEPIADYAENWYKGNPTFNIKIKDNVALKSYEIKVNGNIVKSKDFTELPLITTEDEVILTSEDFISDDVYTYNIEISAIDMATNESIVYRKTINLDNTKPEVSNISIDTDYTEFDGKAYFKTKPNISISAEDTGVGIKEFRVGSLTNDNGIFSLDSGEYNVEVVDYLSNTSGKIGIKELSSLNTNEIVIDEEKPIIVTSRPIGDVNGWFATDVKYEVDLSDSVGINNAKVEINGIIVDSYQAEIGNVKGIDLVGDTSKVKANGDGSYTIKVYVVDNAGNENTWTDTIKIDRTKPTIDKFVFSGQGYQEGVLDNTKGIYGFYFKDIAHCEVYLSDGNISSGLNRVKVILTSYNGKTEVKDLEITGGVASFDLPNDFKGFIEVSATDMVGNVSGVTSPDGAITESSNMANNSISIDITIPSTDKRDLSGYSLYNQDISINSIIGSDFSGIRSIEWGINNESKGKVDVDNNGNILGDTVNIIEKDNNLIIDLNKVIQSSNNTNGCEVWVKVTDRAGYTSQTSRLFSIDKDKPVVEVSYNQTNSGGYYNSNRTATIKITERNFSSDKTSISGNLGSVSGWNRGSDGAWYNTIIFDKDGDYDFTISCTDLAGNTSDTYICPKFTIDKTAPVINVSFNNNASSNGKYYNQPRVATITVTEKNFDPSLISVEGGKVGGWSTNGNIHTASISFNQDGTYKFSVSGRDKAGNITNSYTSEEFIIDQSKPEVTINGIEEGISYKKDVNLSIIVSDNDLDLSNTKVTLIGKRRGIIELDGVLTVKGGTLSISEFPYEEEYDDVYTLVISAIDKAGNLEEQSYMFSINRFGSAYQMENDDILNNYINTPQDIIIHESNIDKIILDDVNIIVLLNGTEIEVPKDAISIKQIKDEGNKYVYEYIIKKSAFSEDGKYTIQVYSASEDGTKYNSISEEYTFILDTTSPEIILSGVEENSRYRDFSRRVTIDIRDLSGVKVIQVYLNGELVTLEENDGIYSFEMTESQSLQNIIVKVEDAAGNTSELKLEDILITSNFWVWLINQLWFRISAGGLSVGLIVLISWLIIAKKRKDKEEENQLSQDLEEMYSSSGSSLGTTGDSETLNDKK